MHSITSLPLWHGRAEEYKPSRREHRRIPHIGGAIAVDEIVIMSNKKECGEHHVALDDTCETRLQFNAARN